MQNSVFYEAFLPITWIEPSAALRNTVNVWDHLSRVTSWCLEQFGWSACGNIVSGFHCLHANYNLDHEKSILVFYKLKEKNDYSSHFCSVTSNSNLNFTQNHFSHAQHRNPHLRLSTRIPARYPARTRDFQPESAIYNPRPATISQTPLGIKLNEHGHLLTSKRLSLTNSSCDINKSIVVNKNRCKDEQV